MAEESDAKAKQPVSIAQARSARAANSKIETTSDEIRKIMTEVVDERLAARISRLETSINRIADHIDAVQRGEVEDSALRVTTDHSAVDLALAGVQVSPEDYYQYTSGTLAEKLEVRLYDVTQMVKRFALRDNSNYHKAIKTGKTCEVHKYSEAAFLKLKEILESGQY